MTRYITPAERVRELVAEHGSYRAAAEVVGVSFGHLHLIANDTDAQLAISGRTAERLGLCVRYTKAA